MAEVTSPKTLEAPETAVPTAPVTPDTAVDPAPPTAEVTVPTTPDAPDESSLVAEATELLAEEETAPVEVALLDDSNPGRPPR